MHINKSGIIPIHNGMQRLKTFTIKEIFDWIEQNPLRIYWELDGIRMNLKRAKIFHKKDPIIRLSRFENAEISFPRKNPIRCQEASIPFLSRI